MSAAAEARGTTLTPLDKDGGGGGGGGFSEDAQVWGLKTSAGVRARPRAPPTS